MIVQGGINMNTKGMLPILGLGMAAGAALSMAIKPQKQAVIKRKAGEAMKTVGEAVENISDAMRMK